MLARIARLRGGSSAAASASAPLRGVAPPDATSARCRARVTGRSVESDEGEVMVAAAVASAADKAEEAMATESRAEAPGGAEDEADDDEDGTG